MGNLAYYGCIWAGVEIKALADQRRTGCRFCFPKLGGTTLISTHSMVPVIIYSRLYEVTSILRYRFAPITSEPTTEETPQPTCYEHELCQTLVKLEHCDSSLFTEDLKQQACPGFCSS
ncbi:hypothetical protein KIN20_012720 [Parelaphostrongylus tenuis]|uniref:Uncharacterized protein n=1 Tax=Parelaphostrongylus tenuis TaxID=148309 RepID=A0AAD5QMZ7_PARTN|nr:hypothetical protein KIN20_012720 [Parelaphostrongylus tenuis]